MKKSVFCLFFFGASIAQAQTFEGIIRWSMKMEMSPAARKKLDDPAMQQKMKDYQAKMNDPQMKALMDANPQMKAQMEAGMKMSQGGGMAGIMPSGFTIEIKDGNILTKIEGPAGEETLYLKDKNQTYRINTTGKTYSTLGAGRQAPPTTVTAPKVTKTSETTDILGYKCVKYLVDLSEQGQTLHQIIWTTTDIKDIDMKNFAKMGGNKSLFYPGMDGVPMRAEMSDPGGEGSMTMEVVEYKKQTLPATDFMIPKDFKETAPGFGR